MQTFIPDFSTIIRAEIHRVNKSTLIHFCFKLTRIADGRIIGTYPNTALLIEPRPCEPCVPTRVRRRCSA
jgi:hypothetical protein